MKIGILTLPLRTNYGGILQAYALQTVLINMGHEAFLIRDKDQYELPVWKKPFSFVKRVIYKYVLRKKNALDVFYEKKIPTRFFIDTYIRSKKMMYVKHNHKNIDAIIVGSDQIWRPKYYHKNIERAYLSFAEKWDIKRISYAVSFGTDEWEYMEKQTENCKNLLELFNAISVREETGINLCKKYFGANAVQVLDPTMLLDTVHYISLIERAKTEKSSGNLFVYVLDNNENIKKIEQEISDRLHLVPFYNSTDYTKIEEITQIEVWIRSFYDAEFILTDSFHACVFSILFNKPFIVYGNKVRGLSRLDTILKLFRLENRLVCSEILNLQQIIGSPINWNEVNEILKKQKEISNQFLINSLQKL